MKYLLLILTLFFSVSVRAESGRVVGIQPLPPTAAEGTLTDYSLWFSAYEKTITDVLQAGAQGLLLAQTWHEMEPKRGQYNQGKMKGDLQINRVDDFQQVLLGIQVINTVKREVPRSLKKKDWDSPEMIAAFRDYIQWTAPQVKNRVHMISIGNEVDTYFREHPEEWDAYKRFYDQSIDYIHQVLPDVRVGTTMTFEGLTKGYVEQMTRLNERSDIVIMTYYPLEKLKVKTADAPLTDLPQMVKFAAGKPLVMQEVGYPTASSLGGSMAGQAVFVENMFKAWEATGTAVPFISFFMQHDFADVTCRSLSDYYGAAQSTIMYDFLCSLGLRDALGQPKPAWDVFVSHAARLR